MTWLIARYGDNDPADELAAAVRRSGVPVEVAKCVPFGGADEYPNHPAGAAVFFVGPIFSVARIAQTARWNPGVWYDPDVFACHTYYGHWNEFILQKNFAMLPLGALLRQRDRIWSQWSRDGEVFIRPDTGLKLFDAELVASEHFEKFTGSLNNAEISPATLVVVSEPVDIHGEYRLVFRRESYVTGSMYRNARRQVEHDADVPGELISFARRIAARPFPGLPPVFCLDVCLTGDGPRLVELTSVNGAGYYACDLDKLVGAVNAEMR